MPWKRPTRRRPKRWGSTRPATRRRVLPANSCCAGMCAYARYRVRKLRECWDVLSLLLPGAPKKSIYDILLPHNLLAESSLFVNLGYWEQAHTYDEACAALAHRLLAGVPSTRDD